jgi:hypothetical protein
MLFVKGKEGLEKYVKEENQWLKRKKKLDLFV